MACDGDVNTELVVVTLFGFGKVLGGGGEETGGDEPAKLVGGWRRLRFDRDALDVAEENVEMTFLGERGLVRLLALWRSPPVSDESVSLLRVLLRGDNTPS